MKTLLEREAALADLAGSARRAARGTGQVVLLLGEAGVGKTTVIDRFLERCGHPGRVLRGWCDPLSTPRPLGPLKDIAAQLSVPETAELAAAINHGAPEPIYTSLWRLLSDGPPWVCVIEDVHWADGATLDLLRFLVRRISGLSLLLIVTYRDDELSERHPLAVALGDVAGNGALTRIQLEPLSRRAVAKLASGSGIDTDRLYQLTGGNPFFVTEVLAAGAQTFRHDGLPRSISDAVRGRLGRLSTPARETAYAAAACGPRVSPALVQAICPAAATGLDACLDSGVLVEEDGVVGFRHELARRAALEQIPQRRRRQLHAAALAVLAEPPIAPDTLSALAFHADQASDRHAVLRYGPAAADRAATLGAHGESADLYGLALRHCGAIAAPTQRAAWLERHAFESYLCGRATVSVASWRAAIEMRHRLGHRLEEGDDLRWLSHLLEPLGCTAEAIEAGRASLQLLEGLGPTPQLAWSLVNMAHSAATVSCEPAIAAEYAGRALALGIQLGDPAVMVRARGYQAMARILEGGTGWDELDTVWRDALQAPTLIEHAAVLGVLICWAAVLHRELDRAEDYLARASAFCDAHDLGMFRALVQGADALRRLYRGDGPGAETAAERILTRSEISPQHRILPLLTLALIRARRGEPAGGLLDEALDCTAGNQFRLHVHAARAEAAWLAGDDAATLAEVHRGLASVTVATADGWPVGELRRCALLAGGTPDTAADRDAVTPYRLELEGDWRAAATEWMRLGCVYDAAVARLGGDIDAVQSALTTFRDLDARAAVRRAQQRLARLRGRAAGGRADTLADPHHLTRRQRDVLELLAAGHSDADIATKLCISPRTVAHHVEAILTKLGVNNRTRAAAVHNANRQSPQ